MGDKKVAVFVTNYFVMILTCDCLSEWRLFKDEFSFNYCKFS